MCSKTFEQFASTISCYLNGYRSNLHKACDDIPNKTLPEHRWKYALDQIKRCIYSRYSNMLCTKHATTLNDFSRSLNTYVGSMITNPKMYCDYFGKHIDKNDPIYKQMVEITCSTTALNHAGVIYSLIKLYIILKKLHDLTMDDPNFDLSTLEICYTKYHDTMLYTDMIKIKCARDGTENLTNSGTNSKEYDFIYADILKTVKRTHGVDLRDPTVINDIINRQLLSIAQKVNHIYCGLHVFSVYIAGEKIVDTYNNIFTPVIYDIVRQHVTGSSNNHKASAAKFDADIRNNCLLKSKKNKKTIKRPTHRIMHYNGNKAYIFLCDEYFGDSIHKQMNALRYKYKNNEPLLPDTRTCMVESAILLSSGNYFNRCCQINASSVTQIYQYIDLFTDDIKRRLYTYILTSNSNKNISNLGIYYILVSMYGKSDDHTRLLVLSNKMNANNGSKTNLRSLFPVNSSITSSLPNFTPDTLSVIKKAQYGLSFLA